MLRQEIISPAVRQAEQKPGHWKQQNRQPGRTRREAEERRRKQVSNGVGKPGDGMSGEEDTDLEVTGWYVEEEKRMKSSVDL